MRLDFGNMAGLAEFLGRNNLWYYIMHDPRGDSKLVFYTMHEGKPVPVTGIEGAFREY